MKASRQKNETHWRSVGSRAKSMNIPIEKVLTVDSTVSKWIEDGYQKLPKKEKKTK